MRVIQYSREAERGRSRASVCETALHFIYNKTSSGPARQESLARIRELIFTLLLKVGVASSFAALLARWNTFRRVLFTEERDPDQKLKLMLFMTPPLLLGVLLRMLSPAYRFADLSVEGAFLLWLLGGRVVG